MLYIGMYLISIPQSFCDMCALSISLDGTSASVADGDGASMTPADLHHCSYCDLHT